MSSSQVCRCCLSEPCFKDISQEYIHGGQKEVYADMLMETFNLTISYQGNCARLICEECVLKLRDATDFRRQVALAESAIIDNININTLEEPVKAETDPEDFLDHVGGSLDLDHADDGCHWQTDTETETIMIKQELGLEQFSQQEPKRKKAKKSDKVMKHGSSINKKGIKIKRKRDETAALLELKTNKENTPSKSDLKKLKVKESITESQLNVKQNSIKLILNSNLCIFESLKTKFRCLYCKAVYLNISELKEHVSIHSIKEIKSRLNKLRCSCKNAEITNLQCKLCSEPQKDLNELTTHLAQTHKIELIGEEHFLVQYKILNGFQCIICEKSFNTYYKLSVHMNFHYTNHVCEICGVSYISRLSLRIHIHSMHKEKKCSKCPATFFNTYLRVKHMKKVHNSAESKRYCLLCDKTFRYTYSLVEHRIEEHGAKRQTRDCVQCGKQFKSEANLRVHMRAVHIRERNHQCQHCGMSFFTSCDQRRHERSHQDIRSFSCSYCEGRFKSKDSLRRHLRRQHGHLYAAGGGGLAEQ